jgi:hypothetical protein
MNLSEQLTPQLIASVRAKLISNFPVYSDENR